MKKIINTVARELDSRIGYPGKEKELCERFREFLVRVTDERPDLFNNAYLMDAARGLQAVYPVMDIEKFYEYKRDGHDHVFGHYEKSLRAFASTGEPKDALRALRAENVDTRDRLFRMVTPDLFDLFDKKDGGVFSVLFGVDVLAGHAGAEFITSREDLFRYGPPDYDLGQLIKKMNMSIETREDFDAFLDKKDILIERKEIPRLATLLKKRVAALNVPKIIIDPEEIREYIDRTRANSVHLHDLRSRNMIPARDLLSDMNSSEDLSGLAQILDSEVSLNAQEISLIMEEYGEVLSPFMDDDRTLEDLMLSEQARVTEFVAGMDLAMLEHSLGRLPEPGEAIAIERNDSGTIKEARFVEDSSPAMGM